MKQIDDGAEAIIYEDNNQIIKDRIPKKYRIAVLDKSLRTSRTKREAKVLSQLPIPGPQLIKVDGTKIVMSKIPGKKVRDILEQNIPLAKEAGTLLATLHDKDIMHGDLTTSNMLFDDKLYFIDFGLSQFSKKIEDKAVDIHLFRCALESKHPTIWEEAFTLFKIGYKQSKNSEAVLARFEQVEARGRNKEKT